MSIAQRIFESRAESFDVGNPRDPVLVKWINGPNTSAGVSVTPDTAMRISAVFACVRILSSAYASMPLDIYRRLENNGREKATDHPLFPILHDQPNRWQTSFEWREQQMVHLLLRGIAYSEILPTGGRAVGELIPLNPDRVMPFWAPDGTIAYKYTPIDGSSRIILQEEMYVLRGISSDGLKGLAPIEYQAETMGLTLAAERFGSSYFGNGTVLSGVLRHPAKLGDEAYERLRNSWNERHSGITNAHKPAILEEGMEWQQLGVSPEQSQFLETRKFQISEIARIFGVPPHMLADVEKTTSWGTGIESQGIGFVVYSLQPYLVRSEQAIRRDLLSDSDQRQYFAEFNVDGLLRGDAKSRSEFYKSGINDGWLTRNEVRAKENFNPLPGLDDPLQPLNMATVGEELAGEEPEDPGTDTGNEDRLLRIISDSAGRIARKEVRAVRRILDAGAVENDSFHIWANEFYDKHAELVSRAMGVNPIVARDYCTRAAKALVDIVGDGDADRLTAWQHARSIDLEQLPANITSGADYGY